MFYAECDVNRPESWSACASARLSLFAVHCAAFISHSIGETCITLSTRLPIALARREPPLLLHRQKYHRIIFMKRIWPFNILWFVIVKGLQNRSDRFIKMSSSSLNATGPITRGTICIFVAWFNYVVLCVSLHPRPLSLRSGCIYFVARSRGDLFVGAYKSHFVHDSVVKIWFTCSSNVYNTIRP